MVVLSMRRIGQVKNGRLYIYIYIYIGTPALSRIKTRLILRLCFPSTVNGFELETEFVDVSCA